MRPRVAELFNEVADLSGDARTRYLSERHIDVATRREVEALLAFDSPWNTGLQIDIGKVAHQALLNLEPKRLPCGPYRLRDLLGFGGMGTVYLGEREDGEVAQRVAVKLLRPGADAPLMRERFLAERQILATLSHPNIARLLDAGHREDGQPYLVMEYLDGEAIDTYSATLSTRQKVSLFLKLCAAVAYLHRNLVVHRDLKPLNILVTKEGEPKLLDFGIAKTLDFSNKCTLAGMRMLTPDYASPEQMAGRPLSTATDIYSLGAVLYAVLTGVSPHRSEALSEGAIASTGSTWRITPPSKLAPDLKGDLEAILMKALRWEPQERYATVEQFSEDLGNYLGARPVGARKGGAWYRAGRFLRRHWFPVATVALAGAGLTTGLLVANHERAIAQRQFAEVRHGRKVPGAAKARERIVGTSLESLCLVASNLQGDPGLALDTGSAHMRVGGVHGVPIANYLGQMDRAEQNLRIAPGFVHVIASLPANRAAILRAAQITHDRMHLARLGGSSDEALARQSAEWLEKLNASKSDARAALHLRAGQTGPTLALQETRLGLWRRWEAGCPTATSFAVNSTRSSGGSG